MNASTSSHRISLFGSSLVLVSLLLPIPIALSVAGCASHPEAPQGNPKAATERIGVYDSRSVAIAWVGTEAFAQAMKSLRKEAEQAKADGDRERSAALEKEGAALQERLHLQGFSTEPVDDILAHFQDQVAAIRVRTGAAALVSKWDAAALATHPGAEAVDVTEQLVDALHPNAQQKKTALEVTRIRPVPLADAKRQAPER